MYGVEKRFRRFLRIAGMALVMWSLAGVAWASPSPASVTITMSEHKFEPQRVTVRAGSTVTIRLVNKGILDHEFMVGRTVTKGGPGGNLPDGYMHDFFDGLTVSAVSASGVARFEAGEAKVTGEAAKTLMAAPKEMEMEHGHHGFMITLKPKGQAVIRLVVPASRAGSWEIGCFEQNGSHYLAGMKGTFTVTR
ncbi:MAG: cupredoxin domain-containing protein [Armatimonadetes bacterium]|nr:cupredoxin domain-containing protein [Armatimonadota bacterium]